VRRADALFELESTPHSRPSACSEMLPATVRILLLRHKCSARCPLSCGGGRLEKTSRPRRTSNCIDAEGYLHLFDRLKVIVKSGSQSRARPLRTTSMRHGGHWDKDSTWRSTARLIAP